MKLRAFFQSDNPTDLRHNETPLAPPKPSWAGGSGDDTWRTWKPWSQEIEKEAMTRRKRWKHRHFTGFFGASWMSCFFQMYHCSLFCTPCTVSNLSFTDLAQGSIATHGIANQEILLVKAVPISNHKYTRYKQLRHTAYCFTTVDGTGRCYAIMPSLIRYLWSLKTNTLSDQPKLRCAPGSWRYHTCHLNVVASHSFKTKTTEFLSGEWG